MEPYRGLEWHEMARRCRGRDAEILRCCVLGLEVRRERATGIEPAFSAWEAEGASFLLNVCARRPIWTLEFGSAALFRMALRCKTPVDSDTIVGQGWAKADHSTSTLEPTLRGVGYLLAEGAVPVKLRTPLPRRRRRRHTRRPCRAAEEPALSSASHWRSVLSEVNQAGLCSNPVRLRGLTLDRRTGQLVEDELVVACKNRRAAVCPSCSRLYQDDAIHSWLPASVAKARIPTWPGTLSSS
jgi:hypothetical protein